MTTTGDRISVGTRLGSYHVDRELGVTAGGVTYLGEHVVLPRRAHLKVAGRARRDSAVGVLREACMLEAVRHAGVPAVFESGLLPDGRPWVAHEVVGGERLSEVMARGPMSPAEVAALIRDVGRVLAHAHRRGVVHAGLRPERIVLTPDRGYPVCVVEWSDARAYDAGPSLPRLPIPGAYTFLAPEARRGEAIDDRADVFALGVVAYAALSGELPGPDHPAPLAARCAHAPRELCVVIDQMLARDRFDRPSITEVLGGALGEVFEGRVDVHGDLAWMTVAPVEPPAPVAEVELIDTDGVPADEDDVIAPPARIRAPRWTPMHLITCDAAGVVSGEIDDGAGDALAAKTDRVLA